MTCRHIVLTSRIVANIQLNSTVHAAQVSRERERERERVCVQYCTRLASQPDALIIPYYRTLQYAISQHIHSMTY